MGFNRVEPHPATLCRAKQTRYSAFICYEFFSCLDHGRYLLELPEAPAGPLPEVAGSEAPVEPAPDVPDPEAPVEPLLEEPVEGALVEGASVGVASVGRPAPDVEMSPGDPLGFASPVAPLDPVVVPLVPDAPLDELCATAIPEMPSAETINATSSLFIYLLQSKVDLSTWVTTSKYHYVSPLVAT